MPDDRRYPRRENGNHVLGRLAWTMVHHRTPRAWLGLERAPTLTSLGTSRFRPSLYGCHAVDAGRSSAWDASLRSSV
jgi:hypothetical protein